MAPPLTLSDESLGTVVARPRAPARPRVFVGRQAIATADGRIHGHEFLYRGGRHQAVRVDRWSAEGQNRATVRVLDATLGPTGVCSAAPDALVFVNFTRSFLVGDLRVPACPDRLVVEVVESVRVDDAVVAGVLRLREEGFRIAIDDFVGLTGQRALLPYAHYVKIDRHDLAERGSGLVEVARRHGATLIAEWVETEQDWRDCRDLGFELFQGDHVDTTRVFSRAPTRVRRRATVSAAVRAVLPSPRSV